MKTAYTETYDRLATGERLRLKRTALGLTQEEMAEKIGRAPKYYADIERGSCGMSVETLMALSRALNMSLDFLIFGEDAGGSARNREDEILTILDILNRCSDSQRNYSLQLLKLFLAAIDH